MSITAGIYGPAWKGLEMSNETQNKAQDKLVIAVEKAVKDVFDEGDLTPIEVIGVLTVIASQYWDANKP